MCVWQSRRSLAMWTNKHIEQIPYNKVLRWAIVMKQNLTFGSMGSLDFMIFFFCFP